MEISYYADKGIDKLNCLMKIYDYINVDVEQLLLLIMTVTKQKL